MITLVFGLRINSLLCMQLILLKNEFIIIAYIYVTKNTGVFLNVPWSLDQYHKHESRYWSDLYSRYCFSISWIQSWMLCTSVRNTLCSLSNTCSTTSHTRNTQHHTHQHFTQGWLWIKCNEPRSQHGLWHCKYCTLLSCNTYFIDHAKTF
jgi:hypothetical protein